MIFSLCCIGMASDKFVWLEYVMIGVDDQTSAYKQVSALLYLERKWIRVVFGNDVDRLFVSFPQVKIALNVDGQNLHLLSAPYRI